MYLFNIVYLLQGVACNDQVYAPNMLEACAMAHVKHGDKVTNVARA